MAIPVCSKYFLNMSACFLRLLASSIPWIINYIHRWSILPILVRAQEVAVEVVALLSVGLLSPVVWVWVIIFSLFFWVLGICPVLLFLMLLVAYKFYYYTFQTQLYINHNNSHSSIILRPKSTSLMVSMNCTFSSTIFRNRRIYFSVE